jgi:hypothetical protein
MAADDLALDLPLLICSLRIPITTPDRDSLRLSTAD